MHLLLPFMKQNFRIQERMFGTVTNGFKGVNHFKMLHEITICFGI